MSQEKNTHQTSLAGGGITPEERERQIRKVKMQKRFSMLSGFLIGVIVVIVFVLILSLNKCKISGHTWVSATCTSPKLCAECDAVEGTALGHAWNDADCEHAKACTVCGTVDGTALGHTWKAANCKQPKTCTKCGKEEGVKSSHSWQAATCTQPKTCVNCGITEGEAIGHDWIAATTANPKTCGLCGETDGNPLLDLVAGDTITMGYYGNEEIVWIVLEFDPYTSQAMLISKYCLDAIPFHAGSGHGSWENSTLRQWLNNQFISMAFSQEERAAILTTQISNPKNPDFRTDSGNDTQDRIFLLSYEEAVYYFPSEASRQGIPTDYCIEQGCYDPIKYSEAHGTELDTDTIGYTWWWLRTAGYNGNRACNVVSKGTASTYGALQTSNEGTIRPVMWVQLTN